MAIYTYKCERDDCNFIEDYIEGPSISKSEQHPEICPRCKKGKMIKDFLGSVQGQKPFDVPGGYSWSEKVKKIDRAIASGKCNSHNDNPY